MIASRFFSHGIKKTSRNLTRPNAIRRWFASYPPHEVVGMPSLSPTMESGTIANWNLKEGDSFGAGDVICSVETDKATVDFEAQDDGIVARILQEAGPDDIDCGVPILVTVEDEDDVSAFANFEPDAPAATDETPQQAEPATSPNEAAPVASIPPHQPTTSVPANTASTGSERVIASPLAYKLAKELGHNIAIIAGTGPGGRIIAADVTEFVPMEEAVASSVQDIPAETVAQAAMSLEPIVGVGYKDYPLSESARVTAARLAQSKRNVPHYYLTIDLSMDQMIKLRATLNETLGEDEQIGVYELLLKAAGVAMKSVPMVNAAWMDSVVRVYDSVDINVVVGNGDALYTPVIPDVSSRGVKAISADLKAAVSMLEEGEDDEGNAVVKDLSPNFSTMGTLTVMNLGMYGIKSCAPIVTEPQAAALAFGVIENRIVPSNDDELYKESVMMTATMSLDHRVVDGAVGAQWLAAFKSHVENPTTLLL